jgi:glyoxylase-like metal-dependent hydrolase (beta-lactamase superfamily II)
VNARIYFETKLVADNIWSISGPVNDLMYLAFGKESAMLVDTGMGTGDLAGLVNSLTNLPVTVINTHGHPDHAGGNAQFPEIWLHPKDEFIRCEMTKDEYRRKDIGAVLGEKHPDTQRLVAGMIHFKPYRIQTINPGQIFDLGNRQFEVLETPGHTPGSVCLINSKEKILFTGDTIVATPVWLYLEHSLPVRAYWETLRKVKERESEFETLFPGHHPIPLSREHLDDLLACAEEILKTPGIGEQTKTFAGEGLLWIHGKGQIIYNPKNFNGKSS